MTNDGCSSCSQSDCPSKTGDLQAAEACPGLRTAWASGLTFLLPLFLALFASLVGQGPGSSLGLALVGFVAGIGLARLLLLLFPAQAPGVRA